MLIKLHRISFARNQPGIRTQEKNIDSEELTGQAKKAVEIFSKNGLVVKKVAVYDNGDLHYVVTPNIKEEHPKHLPVRLELQNAGLGWVTRVYKEQVIEWEFRH